MRAAASGMSREDGFAAMKVEADELKAGKPPKEVGFIHRDGNVFRARVQYREEGKLRDIPGPWRTDEEAAKGDLVAIRAAASGMGRDDGLAAMAAEAKRLREGKPMTEGGCVKEIERSYRAVFRWEDERDVKGPRRAEKHLLARLIQQRGGQRWQRRPVTGGPPLSGALSLYPFGIKESPNGTSLAMYPSVDFALQAQGYVSKGRSFLSDAPFGRFSIPHPRVRQEGAALA